MVNQAIGQNVIISSKLAKGQLLLFGGRSRHPRHGSEQVRWFSLRACCVELIAMVVAVVR